MRTYAVRLLASSLPLVLVVGLAPGCATLGSPPLDEDLISDGSPEAKAALLREYRVVYEDGAIKRPGAIEPGASPSSQAFTDESYNYLSTSAAARDALDSSLFVRMDRATRTGVLPALLALSVPVVVVAGTGAAAFYGYQSVTSSTIAPRGPEQAMASAALYGALGALATIGGATAFWALSSGVLYVLAPFLASGAYRDSTAAFNDELKARIDRLADPSHVRKPKRRGPVIRIEPSTPERDGEPDDVDNPAQPSAPTTPDLATPPDERPDEAAPSTEPSPSTGEAPPEPAR